MIVSTLSSNLVLPTEDTTEAFSQPPLEFAAPILRLRHGDQMHVIQHDAIRPNLHTAILAPSAHRLHLGRVILLAEERRLAAVPPPGHAIRHVRDNHSP